MSGLGIENLPLPDRQFRPDLVVSCPDDTPFETLADAQAEEAYRRGALRSAARTRLKRPRNIRAARALARKLKGSCSYASMASPVWMRDQRIRIGGALAKLIYDDPAHEARFVTVIKRGWKVRPSALSTFDPRKELLAFRSALNREGALDASGYLIVFLEADFDPRTKTYQFHVHGFAAGAMLGVLERLRDRCSFKVTRSGDVDVWARIRISSGALHSLTRICTYGLKSFWKGVPTYLDGAGKKRRSRLIRIPEPYHTQALLWQDRHRLRDMCLMMGLRVRRWGLMRTKHQTLVHE